MSVQEIDTIPIRIPESGLISSLQSEESSDHAVSKRTESLVQRAIEDVRLHIEPRGIYRVLPLQRENGNITVSDTMTFNSRNLSSLFTKCDRAVVFLTTIGKEIDNLIRETMFDSPHYGYVLDAAASAAAEEAAEYVQQYVNENLSKDETTTHRYSPGYCDWPLTDQKHLFGIIPHERIDVCLSEQYLMCPEKSVSGVFGILPTASRAELHNLCLKCRKKDCPYRRA